MNILTNQETHFKYNGIEFNKDLSNYDKLEHITIICCVLNFNIHNQVYAKFPLFSLNLKELILIGIMGENFPNLSSLKNLEKIEIINPSGPPPVFNILGCTKLLHFKCLGHISSDEYYIGPAIDVSNCLELEYYHTRYSNPNLSTCKKLKHVDCRWYNGLECLSACDALHTLIINGRPPNDLNLSNCIHLKYIEVNNMKGTYSHTVFQMPNVTNCKYLTHFKCYGNALLPDLTNCIHLKHFEYNGCYPLTDLSKCIELEYFDYKGSYPLPDLLKAKIIYNGIQS
jgi:hypothetical protein